jgi:hypothetical protein
VNGCWLIVLRGLALVLLLKKSVIKLMDRTVYPYRIVHHHLKKLLYFVKPEVSSLHCSEKPVTGLYSEPYESSQLLSILFKIHFDILPFALWFTKRSLSSFHLFPKNPVFASVMHATCPTHTVLLKYKSEALQCVFFCGFVTVWRCCFYSREIPALRHAYLGAA